MSRCRQLIAGLVGCLAVTQAAVVEAASSEDASTRALRNSLEVIRAEAKLPSLAGGYSVNGTVVSAATGVRNVKTAQVVNNADVYPLGSLTKGMTATVIAMLDSKGSLSHADQLGKLLPAMNMDPAYRSVTLAQLLSHTSGLPDTTYLPSGPNVFFDG